ncbi:MAG: MFS transporter, partial [Rhodoglobus sp.]
AVALWLLFILKQKDTREEGVRIDYPGAALGVIGLGGPVFALIEQGNFGWGSPVIFVPFGVGILALVAFIWWERRARMPMLPLGIFSTRNFALGNLTTVFVYAALSIGGFIIVVYLQQVVHLSATIAALALLPVSLGNVLLSGLFGSLSGKFGPRLFMTLGPIIAGVGYLLMLATASDFNYVTQLLPGIIVFAVGMSMTVAPLTAAILGSIPSGQAGIGSAVNNALARVAGLIATAMIGLIVAGTLDADSFHRVILVTAVLLIVGGVVSFVGIRNPKTGETQPSKVPTA